MIGKDNEGEKIIVLLILLSPPRVSAGANCQKVQKEGAHSEFQTSMMMLVMVVVMMMFFMMMCYQEDSGGTKLPKFAGPPVVITNIAVNSYEKSFFGPRNSCCTPTPPPPSDLKKGF